MSRIDLSSLWDHIRTELEASGIDFDVSCCEQGQATPPKIVCVAGGLSHSIKEMAKKPRDHVVMVRLDEDTAATLDDWIETGAFKSRSEAAALFIREGLKVHSRELAELADALKGVEVAKDRLRKKAREVFASDTHADEDTPS